METCDSKSSQPEQTVNHLGIRVWLWLIRGYQLILSPWIGNQCRFYPSCSHYSKTATLRFGVTKGLALTVWRLARCQPFAKGGYDPVPEKKL